MFHYRVGTFLTCCAIVFTSVKSDRDKWYPGAHPGIVPRELWDKVQAQLDGNLRTHRTQVREQSSSLLTGLIEDGDGNRFTPSFTIKRGRRYRYLRLTASPVRALKSHARTHRGTRLPANELESRVTERLQAFLRSDAQVFDELSATAGESGRPPSACGRGQEPRRSSCPSLPADDLRELSLGPAHPGQRVIVQANNIQVMIRRERSARTVWKRWRPAHRRQSGGRAKANGLSRARSV